MVAFLGRSEQSQELMVRAEESSGTQKGVTKHVIAGKMYRSHLAYKVKVHARLAWCQIWKIAPVEMTRKTGLGRCEEVVRSAST